MRYSIEVTTWAVTPNTRSYQIQQNPRENQLLYLNSISNQP